MGHFRRSARPSAYDHATLKLTALLLITVLMGCDWFDKPVPVTVNVQYVNYTGSYARFMVYDRNKDLVHEHIMTPRTFADAAELPMKFEGVLPMDVAVSVTSDSHEGDYEYTAGDTPCSIPTVTGVRGRYSDMKNSLDKKIVLIEARPNAQLLCHEEDYKG